MAYRPLYSSLKMINPNIIIVILFDKAACDVSSFPVNFDKSPQGSIMAFSYKIISQYLNLGRASYQ
ncbi:MAG TPA: hypothetical protein EYQ88_03835 [Candidatus Thioglobus sp.]|nr:hypothetical protein [Candidatus Thioglobus sp.]